MGDDGAFDANAVLNLERYPMARAGDPGRAALVESRRAELDARQYCVLPGFVRGAALSAMVREVEARLARAYRNTSRRNCYLQRRDDPSLPPDHPRNIFLDASYRMIADDLFPESSLLKRIYHWPPTRALIADIVGADALYPNEDPYQPVNVICYGAGDSSAWHFDSTNAFTVTLMLQAAEAGGEFEIAPNIRGGEDPNEDALREVLKRGGPRVVQVPREPGALVVFRGCNSVHRVTPVRGPTPRFMAVFVYESEAGVTGDPEVNETVYGPRTVAG